MTIRRGTRTLYRVSVTQELEAEVYVLADDENEAIQILEGLEDGDLFDYQGREYWVQEANGEPDPGELIEDNLEGTIYWDQVPYDEPPVPVALQKEQLPGMEGL